MIETIDLENGLVLTLYDRSKKIGADRWLVHIDAEVEVPVDRAPASDVEKYRFELGDVAVFTAPHKRNFIDEPMKEDVHAELVRSIQETIRPYLSHPDFPGRFIHRAYVESLRKKSPYPDA